MKHLPHTILILFCTVFIAADEPQKPPRDTHKRVAEVFYAQVRKAAEEQKKADERESKANRSDTPPTPKLATGVIVDRQGRPIPGASVLVERGTSDETLGKGMTDATGKFQIALLRDRDHGGSPRLRCPLAGAVEEHRVPRRSRERTKQPRIRPNQWQKTGLRRANR